MYFVCIHAWACVSSVCACVSVNERSTVAGVMARAGNLKIGRTAVHKVDDTLVYTSTFYLLMRVVTYS